MELVDRAVLALPRQPGPVQLVQGETLRGQGFDELVPAVRGVPAAEVRSGGQVEAAVGQEGLRGTGLLGEQLGGIELGGGLVRRQQPRPGAALGPGGTPALHDRQRDVGPFGQSLHGFHEGQVLEFLQEGEDVAALVAAEAVVVPAGRADLERRGLLVVEWAQPLEVSAAGVAQRDVLPHHLFDAIGVADAFLVRLGDPPCHARECMTRDDSQMTVVHLPGGRGPRRLGQLTVRPARQPAVPRDRLRVGEQ